MRINLPLILLLSSGLIFLLFSFKRLLRYLRYFQQEEYEAKRYVYWLIKNAAYDKRGSLSLVAAYLIYIIAADQIAAIASQIFLFSIFIYLEQDPRKTGKTKLVMTERATRILFLAAFVLASVYTASLLLIAQNGAINVVCLFLIQFALIQLTPYSLLLSNMLLSPFEKRVKGKFKQEAVDILKKVNPYIIGITGSYGKTSVKAALGEVLNNVLAPTFYPPKSINTEMGITREIRENLKSHHRYAIIEMGAYNVGSIKKLCAFTPPNAGIVTVVGMAHLERFGSRERVYQAKSELAQAVPSEGILVCNGDDPGARRMGEEHPKTKTLFYGMQEDKGCLDCFAHEVDYSPKGTSFKLDWQGNTYACAIRLLGRPALSNLLGVFTMACALGADPQFVIAALRNIEPVDNRLSFSREGSVSFLRDAYNSNPEGFAAALDVMNKLTGKRKILMTPGMIELGDMQYEENMKAAENAAKVCDTIIVVGKTNRDAFLQGLANLNFPKESMYTPDTREEAFNKLNSLLQEEDIVLIENDLPDIYEMVERF